MTRHAPFRDEDLHAFIDGELDARRSAEIRDLIASDAILAQRVADFRADKEQLARLYGPLAERPLPAEWLQRIKRESSPPSSWTRQRTLIALAASLAVILLGGAAYVRLTESRENAIIAEAFKARENEVRPLDTLSDSALAAAALRDETLTTALAMRLKAPDLAKLGFGLSAMKVYSGVPGGKAVELQYRDGGNRLFTLYVRRSSGEVQFELTRRQGISICVWQDDVLGTVMTGDLSTAEMYRLASLAYSGLTL